MQLKEPDYCIKPIFNEYPAFDILVNGQRDKIEHLEKIIKQIKAAQKNVDPQEEADLIGFYLRVSEHLEVITKSIYRKSGRKTVQLHFRIPLDKAEDIEKIILCLGGKECIFNPKPLND